MNSSSDSPPPRKNSERWSKSSNSFSMIGMMWPGTFSRTSGFSRVPRRPGLVAGAVGSIEPGYYRNPSGFRLFASSEAIVEAEGRLSRGHIGVLGDRAVGRLELETRFIPGDEAALDRLRFPTGSGEGLGGGCGAVAGPAVEDDRLIAHEIARLALDVGDRDVTRAGNVACLVLDIRADVDQLGSGLDELLRRCGADLRHGRSSY